MCHLGSAILFPAHTHGALDTVARTALNGVPCPWASPVTQLCSCWPSCLWSASFGLSCGLCFLPLFSVCFLMPFPAATPWRPPHPGVRPPTPQASQASSTWPLLFSPLASPVYPLCFLPFCCSLQPQSPLPVTSCFLLLGTLGKWRIRTRTPKIIGKSLHPPGEGAAPAQCPGQVQASGWLCLSRPWVMSE